MIEGTLAQLRRDSAGWLRSGTDTIIAAAPGRLDVMGGIADYSGATVLEATIGDLAVVALQRRLDERLRVRTTGNQVSRLPHTEHALSLGDFYRGPARDRASLKSYAEVRSLFSEENRWAAYLLGVFYVLLAEDEVESFTGGADVLIRSAVPLGAGVASSASIEVATTRAIAAAYSLPTSGMRLASLCQVVENQVVGAPCGIMDQVTCTLGRAGALLALRCQPHEVLGWHAPPDGYGFIGLDSGVKHAVGGARYSRVRCAAFMGRRIIQDALRKSGGNPARVEYLADVTPAQFRRDFRPSLPVRLSGREFVERWEMTGDAATTVEPEGEYPVRGATEHPIYEHDRVGHFTAALASASAAAAAGDASVARRAMLSAGRLMFGSHRSYSRNCGLGSHETDLIVSLVRAAGPESGLLGAKITGGGSGGTVAVLLEAGRHGAPAPRAQAALETVFQEYERATGRPPRVIAGSAPGADQIAPLRVAW